MGYVRGLGVCQLTMNISMSAQVPVGKETHLLPTQTWNQVSRVHCSQFRHEIEQPLSLKPGLYGPPKFLKVANDSSE